ncbi:MAG: fused response regulator/phosphatase [Bacillota bacterium]|nr:fused response regulator/phosphatase [Bacillota bacterium]
MSHNVLVADDGKMNRFIIKKILNDNMKIVQIFEAVNGLEVFEILEKNDIDLIILDLIMPKKNGFDTLRELKVNSKWQDIPVIVSSTITEISSVEETLGGGAIDYFTKPFSKEDIEIILPLKIINAIKYFEQKKTIKKLNMQIEEELKNANVFQNLMLPKSNQFTEFELCIKFKPSLGIGGDFFDCVETDEGLWFMIADVTGHGIAAGMISSMVKVMFRNGVNNKLIDSPSKMLENMNNNVFSYFYTSPTDTSVVFTGFVGLIENEVLKYSSAGQPFPLLLHDSENKIIPLKQTGMNIGFFDKMTYIDEEVNMNKNDTLLLYTDGLFSSGTFSDFSSWPEIETFAIENMEILKNNPHQFLDDIFWHFLNKHIQNGSEFTDDVAIMLIKLK